MNSVLVEQAIEAERELYVGITIDASAKGPLIMASESGGMDIEEVAQKSPQKIFKLIIDPSEGISPYQSKELANRLNLRKEKSF